jgi:hypothetical protein
MPQPTERALERSLKGLQQCVRRPLSSTEIPITRSLPRKEGKAIQHFSVSPDFIGANRECVYAIQSNIAFEYLGAAEGPLNKFTQKCWLDRSTDFVPIFLNQYRRPINDLVCYLPVDHLSVKRELEVNGVRLVPLHDPEISFIEKYNPFDTWTRCVAVVKIQGTDSHLAAERARHTVTHALRTLRIAMREDRRIHDKQLRFRLGTTYVLDDGSAGGSHRNDVAYELEYGREDLVELVLGQPVSLMSANPKTDIERKADVALRWLERAWMTGEPLISLLYLFFALEALLGNKSEGLKAHDLAFRQAILSSFDTGSFTHPDETWFLYDTIRSVAVHGEVAPEVSEAEVQRFASGVRETLNQYLVLARKEGFARRKDLLKALDQHANRSNLIQWLRLNGHPDWEKYLDRISKSGL